MDKNAKELKGAENPKLHESLNFAGTNKAKPCYRCGHQHDPKTCKFRDAECHTCGKTDHIAPVCRSGPKKPTSGPPSTCKPIGPHKYQKKGARTGGAKWVGTSHSPSESGDDLSTHTVRGATPQPPIYIDKWETSKI